MMACVEEGGAAGKWLLVLRVAWDKEANRWVTVDNAVPDVVLPNPIAEDPNENCRETEEAAGVTWEGFKNSQSNISSLTVTTGLISRSSSHCPVFDHLCKSKNYKLLKQLDSWKAWYNCHHKPCYNSPPGKFLTFQQHRASCLQQPSVPKRPQLQCSRGQAGDCEC